VANSIYPNNLGILLNSLDLLWPVYPKNQKTGPSNTIFEGYPRPWGPRWQGQHAPYFVCCYVEIVLALLNSVRVCQDRSDGCIKMVNVREEPIEVSGRSVED